MNALVTPAGARGGVAEHSFMAIFRLFRHWGGSAEIHHSCRGIGTPIQHKPTIDVSRPCRSDWWFWPSGPDRETV